ncbi:FMN-binding protein MioC [Raoultella terrigena]|uniref:FMN-binding protein MioC n=1 Tax=Raoultella terrigena TaxID=577 RepID=A0A4U9D9G2_RAOTE|nr:FMN-binding protein MioC [Raoultella terrigena]
MADITLISGSTLGSAEYVAEHLAEKLEEAGYSSEIQHGPLIEDLPTDGIWLVYLLNATVPAIFLTTCCPFYEALQEQKADLSGVRFGSVGIGSREYDTSAAPIDKIDDALKACGAKQIGETLRLTSSIMRFRKIRPRFGWDPGKI